MTATVAAGIVVAIIAVYASNLPGGRALVVATVAAIPLLFLGIKFPEIFFALFLTAGFYKADPRVPIPEYLDLTVLFGSLVVISILYRILRQGLKIPALPSKAIVPYLGLALMMLGSLLYTDATSYGTEKFLRFVTITALATFAPLFLFINLAAVRRFFYTLIIISTTMAVEAIFSSEGSFFRTAFGSNYIALARVTGMSLLAISLYFVIVGSALKKKLFWIAVATVNLVGLLAAGARGPVIALVVTIVTIIFLSWGVKMKRSTVKVLIATAFVVLGTGSAFYLFPEEVETLRFRLQVLVAEPGGGTSAAQRLSFLNEALRAMDLSPIIGVGVGGFSTYYIGQDTRLYPHNIVLEVGSELGIIGIGFLLVLVGFCLLELIRMRQRADGNLHLLVSAILALFVYTFLNALLSGDINDNRVFFVWIGVTCALTKFVRPIQILPEK